MLERSALRAEEQVYSSENSREALLKLEYCLQDVYDCCSRQIETDEDCQVGAAWRNGVCAWPYKVVCVCANITSSCCAH